MKKQTRIVAKNFDAVAIVHHHRQRLRVQPSRTHRQDPGYLGLLRRLLRLVAEGGHREHEQADPAIPPQGRRLQSVQRQRHQEHTIQDQLEAKEKVGLQQPKKRFLQSYFVKLHLVVDSTKNKRPYTIKSESWKKTLQYPH